MDNTAWEKIQEYAQSKGGGFRQEDIDKYILEAAEEGCISVLQFAVQLVEHALEVHPDHGVPACWLAAYHGHTLAVGVLKPKSDLKKKYTLRGTSCSKSTLEVLEEQGISEHIIRVLGA